MRDRLMGRRGDAEIGDGAESGEEKEGLSVEVIKYDPAKRLAEVGNDDSAEGEDDVVSTECDRWNLIQRVKKRR